LKEVELVELVEKVEKVEESHRKLRWPKTTFATATVVEGS